MACCEAKRLPILARIAPRFPWPGAGRAGAERAPARTGSPQWRAESGSGRSGELRASGRPARARVIQSRSCPQRPPNEPLKRL